MLSKEAIQGTQKRGVKAISVRVPVVDSIVPARRPVVLKVFPQLVRRSQTAAPMQQDGVPRQAPLAFTDDLSSSSQGKHNRNNLRDLLAQRGPLLASSTSPGNITHDILAGKRHNARTVRVNPSPWQCAASPGDALHAFRRSALPVTKKVQPAHAADASREDGAEGAGQHVDEREKCESQSRTLRGRCQLSKSCHRSLWSQVERRERNGLLRAPWSVVAWGAQDHRHPSW